MKKIGESKEPNLRQLMNMARNLRDKYRRFATVQVQAYAYSSDDSSKAEYWLFVEGIYGDFIKSWETTLRQYKTLMKG